jgi:hypothetical protein
VNLWFNQSIRVQWILITDVKWFSCFCLEGNFKDSNIWQCFWTWTKLVPNWHNRKGILEFSPHLKLFQLSVDSQMCKKSQKQLTRRYFTFGRPKWLKNRILHFFRSPTKTLKHLIYNFFHLGFMFLRFPGGNILTLLGSSHETNVEPLRSRRKVKY